MVDAFIRQCGPTTGPRCPGVRCLE